MGKRNVGWNYRIRIAAATLLVLSLLCKAGLQAAGQESKEEQARLFYTALGDSIPNGYCADQEPEIVSYPELIARDLQELSGMEAELTQKTKNGLTTTKLNEMILPEPEVQEALQNADVVTLTIGANDLMEEFKKVSREILNNEAHFRTADEALTALQEGVQQNPLLLIKIAGAISGWDYDTFETQWKQAAETIDSLRPEGSQFVVTTLYDPVEKMELPGTLNAVVNNLISRMNEIIWSHADGYGYQVAELYDSGIGELTQSDGLHPNQGGQELIRDLIEEKMDLQVFRDMKEELERQAAALEEAEEAKKAAAREAARKAAEEREQQEQKEQSRRAAEVCAAICAAFLLLTGLRKAAKRKRRL